MRKAERRRSEALVGGVREWTDVYSDAHTSRAVLRGGEINL